MATRDHARFNGGPPQFSPADRLAALNRVAEAARLVVRLEGEPQPPENCDDMDALRMAVERLNEIERYQGKRSR